MDRFHEYKTISHLNVARRTVSLTGNKSWPIGRANNCSHSRLDTMMMKLTVLMCILVSGSGIQAANLTPEETLTQLSYEFRREVVEVTENVYVAVGFGASNASMVVGESGLIIIDTTEGTDAAEAVLTEFRKISDKPVKAIIYTHSHRDHISGARVFAGNDNPEIYARANFASELVGGTNIGPILGKRTKRQFG